MEKAAHKILVKLTPIFNQFHQYLPAAFAPIFFCQKNLNPKF
jgi:hypothetical protein